jgi:hypothetical protein
MLKLLTGPKDQGISNKVIELIRATEELYYNSNQDVPEDMFLVEQMGTLLSNLLDNHPELEGEYKDFIGMLRVL